MTSKIHLVGRKLQTTAILAIGLISTIAIGALIAQGQTLPPGNPFPSEDEIEGWLHSGDARMEAWGAHYAVISHNENMVPDLLALTSQWQTCDKSPCQREVMATVLDALIQLNGQVPPDALRNLAPDFPSYVAILLARLPTEESSDLVLGLYNSPPERGEVLQYVSAGLLAKHPPYGFAAGLLASINVHVTVVVVPQGSTGSGYSGFGCEEPGGVGPPPPDWPSTGVYTLSNRRSDKTSMVIDGVDPLYSVRTESHWYYLMDSPCSFRVPLDPSARLRLIAEMLDGSPQAIPWQTSFIDRIEFESVDQVDTAILALVKEQQQTYQQTAYTLAEHGLLAYPEVEGSLPKLQIEIQDLRGPASLPIMPLPALPAGASWTAPIKH
jgi:hypothetical protein